MLPVSLDRLWEFVERCTRGTACSSHALDGLVWLLPDVFAVARDIAMESESCPPQILRRSTIVANLGCGGRVSGSPGRPACMLAVWDIAMESESCPPQILRRSMMVGNLGCGGRVSGSPGRPACMLAVWQRLGGVGEPGRGGRGRTDRWSLRQPTGALLPPIDRVWLHPGPHLQRVEHLGNIALLATVAEDNMAAHRPQKAQSRQPDALQDRPLLQHLRRFFPCCLCRWIDCGSLSSGALAERRAPRTPWMGSYGCCQMSLRSRGTSRWNLRVALHRFCGAVR
ncbi:unnamed protein product [Prorocentrum cordatum]|uniref:Uncharacterized protein n=1 Tax=Prorocentrum cordatum TaxID=2364126 RepID=A0ABN9PZH2_9DINO|nr:unnamed protein product [Polarella glacialis]